MNHSMSDPQQPFDNRNVVVDKTPPPASRRPSWVKCPTDGESDLFKELARQYMLRFPPSSTQSGNISVFYAPSGNVYYYQCADGFWAVIGGVRRFEDEPTLKNFLRFEPADPRAVKRYTTD